MVTSLIKDKNFVPVGRGVKMDSKHRVTLKKGADSEEGIVYNVYRNQIGQIVLDPQVTIPAYEAWLYKNKAAYASVKRGLSQKKPGKYIGSFSKYTKDDKKA